MHCDLGLWVDGDVSPLALNTGRVRRWMQECLGYDDSDDSPAPSPNPPADGRGAPLGATGAALDRPPDTRQRADVGQR